MSQLIIERQHDYPTNLRYIVFGADPETGERTCLHISEYAATICPAMRIIGLIETFAITTISLQSPDDITGNFFFHTELPKSNPYPTLQNTLYAISILAAYALDIGTNDAGDIIWGNPKFNAIESYRIRNDTAIFYYHIHFA